MIAAALGALISVFLYFNVIITESRVQWIELCFTLGDEQSEPLGVFPTEDIFEASESLKQDNLSFIVQFLKIIITNRLVEDTLFRNGELRASRHGVHRVDSYACPVRDSQWKGINSYVTLRPELRNNDARSTQVNNCVRYPWVWISFARSDERGANDEQSSSFRTNADIDGIFCGFSLALGVSSSFSSFFSSLSSFLPTEIGQVDGTESSYSYEKGEDRGKPPNKTFPCRGDRAPRWSNVLLWLGADE
jgi:hypothetical protein